MKKTLLTFSVFIAVVCCTLAFAANSEGRWPFIEKSGATSQETKTNALAESSKVEDTNSFVNTFSNDEVNRATSCCKDGNANKIGKRLIATKVSTNTNELITVDLWGNAPMILPLNDGGNYDEVTNTITFPGSESQTYQLFAGVDESGSKYYWYASSNTNYTFSGTLTSEGEAMVYPGIVYRNTSENKLYVSADIAVALNEDNNYTADFEVISPYITEGYPLMVVFFVEGASAVTTDEETGETTYPTITSTNNNFYYTVDAKKAEKWTSENTMTGLGFDNLDKEKCYTVACDDGMTTLGLYFDGNLYVTGINSTAESATFPNAVLINDNLYQIRSLGYYGYMDWSSANILSLDINTATEVYVNSFGSYLTDLYIGGNCSFNGDASYSNIYLHIPYGNSRGNYTWYGFKRVLVGEEQSYYPVSNNADWVIAGENEGEYFGISLISGYYRVIEVFTDSDSVNLPVATPAAGGYYYIRYMGSDDYYNYGTFCQSAPNLKSVTVPETYTNIRVSWNYNPVTNLYMQGDVPSTYWSLPSKMNVYVANQSYFSNYENNSGWNSASILPDGWEFEWMTINVGRKGEFAQTYIEMTDANWALGAYVKITGTLNTTDLQNINNLTSLRKLDLSEAEFTSLPNSFLESKYTLMEVYLPDYLTSIPQYAFRYCSALSLVSAPGVTSIGSNAFYNCSKLSDFDISKVRVINQNAFYGCSQFNPTDLSSVYSIGSSAFYNTAIKEVTIPDGVSTINSSVFSNCTLLSKVTLPNTITSIGSNAFNQCTALTTINLPEGITSIGYDAFNNCTRIPEITLPSTLQSIGYDIFDGCSSLTSVKCKAIVPPTTNGDFTYGVDLNHCTLYIAPFAIDAYRAAADWSNFYIMKPLNEPVKNIYINRPMTFDLLSEDNAVLQENPNMTLDHGESTSKVGQLSASGDGTLSAGIFTIYHSFGRRQSPSLTDYRTTLVNNAENMRADSVVCSISFEKNRWHFISFQYDVQMSDVYGLNNTDFVIRQYNSANRATGDGTTSNWEPVPSDGVLEAGKGYIIQAANNTTNENGNSRLAVVRFPSRNTVTKNKLFTSNNVIVPLEEYPAEFAHNRSWNLVGNPYPCYYDMHYLMDDFTTPIVLWRGTSYQAYSPVDDDIILRPNESFFVQRPLDAEQMVFGVDGRMHYYEAMYATNYDNSSPGIYYAPLRNTSGNLRSVFNFNIEGCGNNDRTRIVMNEDASMAYEINRDASKFFAESCQGVEIYVDGDIKYDICERPLESGVATLGTRIASDGVYSISLNGRNMEGWTVVLTDTKTGASVNLMESAYEFDAEAGTDASRFLITFKAPGQSSIDEVSNSANNGIVRIVNISGINVYEGTLDNFTKSAPTGVYIVVTEDKTFKIVVK